MATASKRSSGDVGEKWLSIPEASKKTGYSEVTIRGAIKQGKLRALRPGSRNFKIIPEDLYEWSKAIEYDPSQD